MFKSLFFYQYKRYRASALYLLYMQKAGQSLLRNLHASPTHVLCTSVPGSPQKPENLPSAAFPTGFCPLRLQVPLFLPNKDNSFDTKAVVVLFLCLKRLNRAVWRLCACQGYAYKLAFSNGEITIISIFVYPRRGNRESEQFGEFTAL